MKSSSSYILLTMLIGSALIGMVSAQNTADITFTGDVPAVLIVEWRNQTALNWVFDSANQSETSCNAKFDSGYDNGVCYFNDGASADPSAYLYMEYNGNSIWNVTFAGEAGDAKMHRTGTPQFTPAHDLNMTRHTSGTGDVYEPFDSKFWTMNPSNTDCSITPDQGGSCNVGIEVSQGITDSEVHPGAGRLKQGTYSATIIADMIV